MFRFRIAAKLPTLLALGAMLAIAGCDEEPQVPDEVARRAREREEAEERALDELERRRREGRKATPKEDPPAAAPRDEASEAPRSPPEMADPVHDEVSETKKSAEPPAIPTSPVVPPKSAALMRWSQLKSGMTTADVVELLGNPTSASSDLYLDYWTYGQGRAAGRVAFIRSYRRLIAWDPPID